MVLLIHSHVQAVCQGGYPEWQLPVSPTYYHLPLNMTVDKTLPDGTCGRGARHVLTPHTTQPLVDNRHLITANSSLKSKPSFAQKL